MDKKLSWAYLTVIRLSSGGKGEKIGEEARRFFPVLPRFFFFFFFFLPFSPNAELGPKLLSLNKPADTVRRIFSCHFSKDKCHLQSKIRNNEISPCPPPPLFQLFDRALI